MSNTYNAIGTANPDDSFDVSGTSAPKVDANAAAVAFDNTNTDLSATNVQTALEEVDDDISQLNASLTDIGAYYSAFSPTGGVDIPSDGSWGTVASVSVPKGIYVATFRCDQSAPFPERMCIYSPTSGDSAFQAGNDDSTTRITGIIRCDNTETISACARGWVTGIKVTAGRLDVVKIK